MAKTDITFNKKEQRALGLFLKRVEVNKAMGLAGLIGDEQHEFGNKLQTILSHILPGELPEETASA